MKPLKRLGVARAQGYCINCLALTHTTGECDSPGSCKTCRLAHHTLLHVAANNHARTGQRKQQPKHRAHAGKPVKTPTNKGSPEQKAQSPRNQAHNMRNQASQPPRKKTARRSIARTLQGLTHTHTQRV
ncbi:uncharacterized protein LOC118750540 [Rhagoletis pomonella]|uniref:uncharacterized protein LOC118750540 n=1 Tax=Rhagoletis pomonella TaxID=28610 RepID=UPI0017824B99|nr:uncharacterized protein LOC118750540 [Rhagoletis pomonella]